VIRMHQLPARSDEVAPNGDPRSSGPVVMHTRTNAEREGLRGPNDVSLDLNLRITQCWKGEWDRRLLHHPAHAGGA